MGKREKVLEKARDCWKKGRAPCPKAWVRAKGGGQGRGGRRAGDGPAAAPEGAAAAAATPGCPRPSMAMQGMELCAVAVVILLFIAVLKQFGILEPISAEGNPRPPPRAGVGRGSVLGCSRWGRAPGDAPRGGAAGGVGASPGTSVVDPEGFGVPFTATSQPRGARCGPGLPLSTPKWAAGGL